MQKAGAGVVKLVLGETKDFACLFCADRLDDGCKSAVQLC